MSGKRRRRGITPWKKTVLKGCFLMLLIAAGIHLFRIVKAYSFDDQREATRWASQGSSAQVSAFLPAESALKQEEVQDLEYKINTTLAQDSIKLTATGADAKLWQDCYSGIGNFTIKAGSKTVDVEAVGTGGAFFTFHPLKLSSGSYYLSDSLMKDEILLDQETAWKLFGAFNVEGRTVQVEDMHLRIAGVYKKGEGNLYDEAGLADYVVFVQYKTLLQYGGSGSSSGSADQAVPNTASIASEEVEISIDDDQGKDDAGASSKSEAAEETETGTDSGTSGSVTGSGSSETENAENTNDSGSSNSNTEQNTENVGTSNTAYKDTGKITCYEIVMPNPVEGYAAATLKNALGEDSGAVVVDNTNRYEIPHLMKDLKEFAILGMRTRGVRYPYWENVAMGWESIYAALFLAECFLILMTVLLIVWMIIHWYRTKPWTVASTIRDMQDSVYERQSRKRYPEYYREKEEEAQEQQEKTSGQKAVSGQNTGSGMLEDKGVRPFEKIPENRKAVQYETIHQNDQRSDGSSAGTDNDGVRRGQQ